MMRILLAIFGALCYVSLTYCQPYKDYIGAGHNKGIIVTTSSNFSQNYNPSTANGDNTINGSGLEGKKAEAARLLSQAAIGYSTKDIDYVASIGIEKWVKEQLQIEAPNYFEMSVINNDIINKNYLANGVDSSEISINPNWRHWRYSWWQNVAFGDDLLRNRVAFALSQILVISDETIDNADALTSYYQLLSKYSFGNFRDLLRDVTLHPAMGYYLSHLNNPKSNPEENIHPDQNYAREIMQLFTIGLYELNLDGSRVKDANGKEIPTYNNKDIEELAKVFTGLGIGAVYPDMGDLYFGRGIYGADLKQPMIMFDDWHEPGEKKLFGVHTFADGQSGMQDINQAIDILFNHKNTPPFICKQLIQRLVTSNPSPEYIQRVASVFINDGKGVRGNLGAVIEAILLDDEARSCENISNPSFGKVSEPTIRQAHFIKGIGVALEGDLFLNHSYSMGMALYQHPLSAPSVFNFYKPDYQPVGSLQEQELVSPELQIINGLSILEYPNYVERMLHWSGPDEHWEEGPYEASTDLLSFFYSAMDEETFINRMDLIFCNGNMQPQTRSIIKKAVGVFSEKNIDEISERIKMGLYLTLLSPDYMVNK